MKKILKIVFINFVLIVIIGFCNKVYSIERFVDIPVPPDIIKNADFSDKAEDEKKYEENQENKSEIADKYIGKSNNNLLKKLVIEGYKLEPDFNSNQNDYTIDVNNDILTKINVIVEAEDENAMIEGNGSIELKNGQDIININVIAENGNLNVYTIVIKNAGKLDQKEVQKANSNQEKFIESEDNRKNNKVIIFTVSSTIIIICLFLSNKKKRKH